MAKLAALILLIVAVASASAYRGDRCEQEMEQHMPMARCMKWAQSKMRYEDAFLRSAVAAEEHLQECCDELRQLSSECRCSAVKGMMMEMPELETERMMCSLPRRCGMSACACPRFFA